MVALRSCNSSKKLKVGGASWKPGLRKDGVRTVGRKLQEAGPVLEAKAKQEFALRAESRMVECHTRRVCLGEKGHWCV